MRALLAFAACTLAAGPLAAQDWVSGATGTERRFVSDSAGYSRYERYGRADGAALLDLLRSPVLAVVAETEPNDSLATAQNVVLGDVVTGAIDPQTDRDYFAVSLVAGTLLDVDVDAATSGSDLNAVLALFDIGSTDADQVLLAVNDDAGGPDSRLIYEIPVTGTYIVGLGGLSGGPTHTYSLRFGSLPLTESESNGSPASADLVNLGDVAVGVLSQNDDSDFYAFDVTAGTLVDFDLEGASLGSPIDAHLVVWNSNGVTSLAQNGDADGIDPRVLHYFAASGRFFLQVLSTVQLGGPEYLYAVRMDVVPTGAGDPMGLFADTIGVPAAIVAGHDGSVYLLDQARALIQAVDLVGNRNSFEFGLDFGVDLAVDGFGDLLVTGFNLGGVVVIQRVTTTGALSLFTEDIASAGPIAVDRSGNVWAYEPAGNLLVEFDPFGARLGTVPVPEAGPLAFDMAFSPDGLLHITDGEQSVIRVGPTANDVVLTEDPVIDGIAFDQAGGLYVSNGFVGQIRRYDASYQVTHDPFARSNLGGPIHLGFGRDASGNPTSQLLAAIGGARLSPPYTRSIVSANPTGPPAGGWETGTRFLAVTPVSPEGVIGTPYTSTPTVPDAGAGVSWRIFSGALPPGLALDAATGEIAGTPITLGAFEFTLEAAAGSRRGFVVGTITIGAPGILVVDVIDAFFGVPGLITADDERFLDLIGNGNGFLDVGDIQAFVRFRALVPPTAPPAPDR